MRGHATVCHVPAGAVIAWAPEHATPALAWIDDAQLKLYDVQYHCAVNCNIAASELCVQHGDLYIRAHQHVTRIGLQRLGQRLLASSGASLR